jgi:hypothetical protein
MSNNNSYSRRDAMGLAARVSAGAAFGGLLSACGGGQNAGPVCVDTDDLSVGEASMRKANNYVEVSSQPEKNCANCAFFKIDGAAGASCGNCEIFNGPANQAGYCDSWSAKQAPA